MSVFCTDRSGPTKPAISCIFLENEPIQGSRGAQKAMCRSLSIYRQINLAGSGQTAYSMIRKDWPVNVGLKIGSPVVIKRITQVINNIIFIIRSIELT